MFAPSFNHWYDKVPPSVADAVTENVTDCPAVRVAATGCEEMTGVADGLFVVTET